MAHIKAGGDVDDPVFNSKIQAIGKTYDLAQFQEFYELNKNDVRKEAPYPGYVNEHGTLLYVNEGVVGVGTEIVKGDAQTTDVNSASAGKNNVGELHTHPNAGKPANLYGVKFGFGPSSQDEENNSEPYYNVVVDSDNIYLSGSSEFPWGAKTSANAGNVIIIPRRGTFNRASKDVKIPEIIDQ